MWYKVLWKLSPLTCTILHPQLWASKIRLLQCSKCVCVCVRESMVNVYTLVALLTTGAVCGVSTLYLYLTCTLPLPYRQANNVRDAAVVKLTGYN